MNLVENNVPTNTTDKTRHPSSLSILFLTEMWERFGFYIVEGLLILYLTHALGFADSAGYAVLGAFTAFVYISPVVGGYIADKILGFKNSILVGVVMLCVGYAFLSIAAEKNSLYAALAIIIVGNGFFKPNISSLLGALYVKNDPRRDSGFTIFYIGINTGGLLATLIAGFVKDHFGWGAGFGLSSIGLFIGMITFIIGLKSLKKEGLPPEIIEIKSKLVTLIHSKTTLVIATILSIFAFMFLLHFETIANVLLFISGIVLLLMLFAMAYKKEHEVGKKLLALILLTLVSIVFWAVFFQMWFSVNLYIDRDVNRHFMGIDLPTVFFLSFEPFYIIILGLFLAKLWETLNRKKKNIATSAKFSLAFFFIALGFAVLALSTYFHDSQNLVNPFWIVGGYFFVTVGELLLSPIGLAAVTVLAPPELVGMMMGVWLIAIGFGGKLAGVIANFSSIPKGITNTLVESRYYGHAFWFYVGLSIVLGFVLLALVPILKKLMNETG